MGGCKRRDGAEVACAMELVCGPLRTVDVEREIPFACAIVAAGTSDWIETMYGVGCQTDNSQLWQRFRIRNAQLQDWISASQGRGIYTPGECDVIVYDGDRLRVHLCHESDIHIETTDASIIRDCVSRWLGLGHRIQRKRESAGKGWKEVWSVDEALAGLTERP